MTRRASRSRRSVSQAPLRVRLHRADDGYVVAGSDKVEPAPVEKKEEAAKAPSPKKPKHEAYDPSDADAPIPNNYSMYSLWSGDQRFHPCVVLARRKRGSLTEAVPPAYMPEQHRSHPFSYYVHFIEFDRRMDQWTDRELMLDDSEIELPPVDEVMRREDAVPCVDDDHTHSEAEKVKHEQATKVKNVDSIVIGHYEMEAWYFSPFPVEYAAFNKLYFCEYCLQFFGHIDELRRHAGRCLLRHPPGNEVYRSQEHNVTVAMFEVDGAVEEIYCQNLCLIAKLFLDHKTLYYDTKIFLFYVLCEVDDEGCHIVGFFSKETNASHSNNLACILTLPCHQKKRYGNFLISFSYELSKIEGKAGTPEKPLSDLGRVSYMSYWSRILLGILRSRENEDPISIEDLSHMTGILVGDIYHVFEQLSILTYKQGEYAIEIPTGLLERVFRERKVDDNAIFVRDAIPQLIRWVPYIHHTQVRKPRK